MIKTAPTGSTLEGGHSVSLHKMQSKPLEFEDKNSEFERVNKTGTSWIHWCNSKSPNNDSYGDAVLRVITGDDFYTFKGGIQTWPCRFRDSEVETRYLKHLQSGNATRAWLAAIVGLVVYGGIFVGYTICAYRMFFDFPTNIDRTVFTVELGLSLVTVGLLFIAALIKKFHPYLESFLYVCQGALVGFHGASSIWNAANYKHAHSRTHALLMTGLTDSNTFFHVMFAVVVVTLVVQSRTRIAVWLIAWLNFWALAIAVVHTVVLDTVAAACDMTASSCPDYKLLPFSLLHLLSNIGPQTLMSLYCFFWRWIGDIQERVEFYRLYLSEKRVRELQLRKRRKRESGTSAVEDIIGYIEHTQKLLDQSESQNSTASVELAETRALLGKCLDLLSRGDRALFQIRRAGPVPSYTTGAITAGASSAVAFHLPTIDTDNDDELEETSAADAAVEAQFYALYGGQEQLPGYLGFGGPVGRTEFSTSAIATSHTLPMPSSDTDLTGSWDQSLLHHLQSKIGREWSLDLIAVSQMFPKVPLLVYGGFLALRDFHLFASSVRQDELLRVVVAVHRLYQGNPYHNSLHGIQVCHGALAFTRLLKLFHTPTTESVFPLEAFIIGWAALVHDIAHPGRTNAYYMHAYEPISILYNDTAALENFHCSLSFRVLRRYKSCVFSDLTLDELKTFRAKVIECILVTDMAVHFSTVNKLKIRRRSPEFNFWEDPDDFWLVAKSCIKAADLGHAMTEWSSHLKWSLMVAEEFYQMGDIEASIGFPKSPLCDRSMHADFAKSQKGFLEFVVAPLLRELEEVDNSGRMSHVAGRPLQYNRMKWEDMAGSGQIVEIPASIAAEKILRSLAPGEILLKWLFGNGNEESHAGLSMATGAGVMAVMEKEQKVAEEDNDLLMTRGSTNMDLVSQASATPRASLEVSGNLFVPHPNVKFAESPLRVLSSLSSSSLESAAVPPVLTDCPCVRCRQTRGSAEPAIRVLTAQQMRESESDRPKVDVLFMDPQTLRDDKLHPGSNEAEEPKQQERMALPLKEARVNSSEGTEARRRESSDIFESSYAN